MGSIALAIVAAADSVLQISLLVCEQRKKSKGQLSICRNDDSTQ